VTSHTPTNKSDGVATLDRGAVLRMAMGARGLNIATLARAAGVARATIYRILRRSDECGTVQRRTLVDVARAAGLDDDALLPTEVSK